MRLFEPVLSRRELGTQFIWFCLWVVTTGFAVYLHPSPFGHGTHQELGFPPCPVVLLFDRPCPGCGLTTSWTAFVHGDFALSWRAHPLGPLTYALFSVSALLALYGFWTKRRLVTETRLMNWGAVALGTIFLTFGIYRTMTTTGYADQVERMYLQVQSVGQDTHPKGRR